MQVIHGHGEASKVLAFDRAVISHTSPSMQRARVDGGALAPGQRPGPPIASAPEPACALRMAQPGRDGRGADELVRGGDVGIGRDVERHIEVGDRCGPSVRDRRGQIDHVTRVHGVARARDCTGDPLRERIELVKPATSQAPFAQGWFRVIRESKYEAEQAAHGSVATEEPRISRLVEPTGPGRSLTPEELEAL